ncbi:hypothetical protein EMIT0P12_20862 [Pseudomonas sp. IT-P12]
MAVVLKILRIQVGFAITGAQVEAIGQVKGVMSSGPDLQTRALTILAGQRHALHFHIDSKTLGEISRHHPKKTEKS